MLPAERLPSLHLLDYSGSEVIVVFLPAESFYFLIIIILILTFPVVFSGSVEFGAEASLHLESR